MKRYLHTAWRGLTLGAVLWLILGSHALFFTACAAILYSVVLPIVVIVALILSKAAFENRFGFLRSITNSQERRRVADSIRRMASLDKALLVANPREAVIALFYTGVAALQDLALSHPRRDPRRAGDMGTSAVRTRRILPGPPCGSFLPGPLF